MVVLDRRKNEVLQHFQIPSTAIIMVKAIMDDMVAKFQVQTEMTELFESTRWPAPLSFSLVMEYVDMGMPCYSIYKHR